ncbi:thioesterase II family protein [Actinoplanes sp. NPDC049599]|uniref:thioesterase II family protein n=1 Tax=Actinoplanes sp. NPDC049599 TaxID=3363903 RepID=UPI0037B277DD
MSEWLHCRHRLVDPAFRLVCLPHAGGSASFFDDWAKMLPGVEVHAVRYPGRAERIAEPFATDLRTLAADIATALRDLADRPLALFGHSMGAAVALETARALEASGIDVRHLWASGSRIAALPEPQPSSGETTEEDIVADLLRMGGSDPELLADPDFLELVLPYMQADADLFHSYEMAPAPMLRCPITAIVGDADDDADRRPWNTLSTGPVRQATVRGGHFYLIDEPPFELLMKGGESLD